MIFIFSDIRAKIERAARTGEKLHLDPTQVRALVRSPVFARLSEMSAEEFASAWAAEPSPEPNSAPSGSTGVQSVSSGSSHGMTMAVPDETVEHAVRQRAWRNMAAMENPRKKRSTT